MSARLAIDDILFRRSGDDEWFIVVHGETVGTVTRRPDIAAADPDRFYYAAHLCDDHRGPRLIDDRREVRPTVARMLVERDLVPPAPLVHPSFRNRHAAIA